jgi:MFS family permease
MFWDQGLYGLLWLAPWLLFASAGRGLAADGSQRSAERALPGTLSLFRSKLMWGVLIGTFCYNYFATFALSWLPAYFVERRHLTLTSMGIYTGFSFAGTAIVAILGGFAADWMIARGSDPVATRRGFTVAGLLIASTVIVGAVVQSVNAAVFFSILSMAGLGLATANYWSLTQVVMPKEIAGRAAGAQNMAVTAAGIVAPIATGWLKQISGGYTVPMAAIAVLMAVGISAYVFMVRVPRELHSKMSLV